MLATIQMVARRRTSRIAHRLTGRWLRPFVEIAIEIADISADGLFLAERVDMPLGQLQQIEIDLPPATVRLLVVPRHVTHSEWGSGMGLAIFASSALDRTRWLERFRAAGEATTPKRDRSTRPRELSREPG